MLDKLKSVLFRRERIRDLRSSSALKEDLAGELRILIEVLDCAPGRTIDLAVDGPTRQLKALLQDEVLRIIREALANACQHSEAKRFTYRSRIALRACDVQCGMMALVWQDHRYLNQKHVITVWSVCANALSGSVDV